MYDARTTQRNSPRRNAFEAAVVRIGVKRASKVMDDLTTRLAARGVVVETSLDLDDDAGEIILYACVVEGPNVFAESRLHGSASTSDFIRAAESIGDEIVDQIERKRQTPQGGVLGRS